MTLDPGYYRISVRSDDGVRVWLDGGLIIDQWQEVYYELHYVDGVYLSGTQKLAVQYYEKNGSAGIRFWISPAVGAAYAPAPFPAESAPLQKPVAYGPWRASYFANNSLEGEPALVREDAANDFDWKYGSPDCADPTDL